LEDLARDYLAIPGRLEAAAALLAGGAKPLAPQSGIAQAAASAAPAFVEPRLSGLLRLPDGRVLRDMSFSQAASQIAMAAQVPRLIHPDPALRVFERRGEGQRNFEPFAHEADDSAVDAAQIVPPMSGTAVAGGNADALGHPLMPAMAAPATLPAAGASGAGTAVAGISSAAPGKFGDRIIVFAPGTGLEVFAAGSPKALLICSAVTTQPQAAGFVGDGLLVAADDHLMRINAGGEVVWDFSVRTLGEVEVAMLGLSPSAGVASAAPGAQDDGETAAQRQRDLITRQALAANGLAVMPGGPLIVQQGVAQQIVIINGQAVRIGRMGAMGIRPADAQSNATGEETIAKVAAAGNRVAAVTSEGRLLCVDQKSGHLLWQTRLDDRAVDQLLVNEDFVAVRCGAGAMLADEQSTAHIAVFDTDEGHCQFERSFGADPGPPINMALAANGTLVWLQVDRIAGKNLFEPGPRLQFETFPWQGANNVHCFASEGGGAMGDDQLVIDGHRIVAAADSGLALRAFDLDDGQPVALPDGTTRINLASVPNRWDVHIRAAGDGVYYAWSNGRVQRIDFGPSPAATQPASWQWPFDPFARSSVDDIELSDRYVMVFYEPFHRNPPQSRLRMCVDCVNPESVYIELHQRNILDASGIADFRLVDGGFYYLSGNGRLHFLPGAGRK
jgi:outer membrane protein assembly factor BamB